MRLTGDEIHTSDRLRVWQMIVWNIMAYLLLGTHIYCVWRLGRTCPRHYSGSPCAFTYSWTMLSPLSYFYGLCYLPCNAVRYRNQEFNCNLWQDCCGLLTLRCNIFQYTPPLLHAITLRWPCSDLQWTAANCGSSTTTPHRTANNTEYERTISLSMIFAIIFHSVQDTAKL